MDQQGKGPAAWSDCEVCGRQTAMQVGSGRQLAEAGVQQILLFRKLSNWKPGMPLGHVQ